MTKAKPNTEPASAFAPAPYTRAQVIAIQALFRGEADAEQQRIGREWILDAVCRVHDLEYRPGSFDQSAFAGGRRFVGQQIQKMLRLTPAAVET